MDTIFVLTSRPLRDILPALMKPSQNQIAEILLRTIGLEREGLARPIPRERSSGNSCWRGESSPTDS